MIGQVEKIDICERDNSLPLLVKCLEDRVEPPITARSLVLITRYLRGWKGLYLTDPPRLTLEGGTLLLGKWIKERK